MANQELTTHEKQELKQDEQTRPGRTFVPDVDIYETTDSLWLWADMPGIEENSLASQPLSKPLLRSLSHV